jgi:hypothetical protein
MYGRRHASHRLPLSPLIGAFFLNVLDAAAAKLRLFYVRFMVYLHPGLFGKSRHNGTFPLAPGYPYPLAHDCWHCATCCWTAAMQ